MANNNTTTANKSVLGSVLGTVVGCTADLVKLAVKGPIATVGYTYGVTSEIVDQTKLACGIEGNLSDTLRHVIDTDVVTLVSNASDKGRSDVKASIKSASDLFNFDDNSSNVDLHTQESNQVNN